MIYLKRTGLLDCYNTGVIEFFKATVKQRGPVLAMGGDEGLIGVGGRVYFKKHHDIWTFEHECSNFSHVRRSLSMILVTFPDHQTIRT